MPRNVPTSAAATLCPISSGGPPKCAHCNHHSQHRRYDAQAGKGIRHRRKRRHLLHLLVMMHFHVAFHHLIHVERFHAATRRHSQRVAHKMQRVMVL